MKKLDSTDQASPKRTIYGVSRDSGGGWIVEGLAWDLWNHNRIAPFYSFFGATFYPHGHSLLFKSHIETHFILGRATKRMVLQLLHAACALEQESEIQDLRAV